jgi:hypothetical protein
MRVLDRVVLSLIMVLAFSGSAYAYLDPGTGSLIVQGAIAAVGAILLAGRMYWAKMKGALGRARGAGTAAGGPLDDEESSITEQHPSSTD